MHRLDEKQIGEFVERGYLLLRDCLPAEARTMVHDTLVRQDPPPTYRGRQGSQSDQAIGNLDLSDATTWGAARLDVQTQRSLPIATFAPKLWGAITSLIGSDEQVCRRKMGQQFILNANFAPRSSSAIGAKSWVDGGYWHIDMPDHHSSLRGRRDALVLLVLWSDVEPDSGGPLFSPGSLKRVTRELEVTPRGVDTLVRGWGAKHAKDTEILEFHGRVGDVLITHAFALHSAQKNHSNKIRVLENPTITVASALDYSADNPNPTPVEACVIRRLSKGASSPRLSRCEIDEGARVLRAHHPDYFLPGRARWHARHDAETRAATHDLDRALMYDWARRVAAGIADENSGPLHQIRAAIAVIREVFVNELTCDARPDEGLDDPDFSGTAWARLGRGFVNCEGQNYALACVLDQLFDGTQLFAPGGPTARHVLVRVETCDGWAFADAWSARDLFFVEDLEHGALPGVPELAALPSNSDSRSYLPRGAYEHAAALPWKPPTTSTASFDELIQTVRGATDSSSQAGGDPWSAFLGARLLQLAGEYRGAAKAYTELRARLGGRGVTARVAAEFERRTRTGRGTLDGLG